MNRLPEYRIRSEAHEDRKVSGLVAVLYGWSAITALFLLAVAAFVVHGGFIYVLASISAVVAFGAAYGAQWVDCILTDRSLDNRRMWLQKFLLFQILSISAAGISGLLTIIGTLS